MVRNAILRITSSVLLCLVVIFCQGKNEVKIIGQFVGVDPGTVNSVSLKASFLTDGGQTFTVSPFNSFSGIVDINDTGICELTFKSYSYYFIIGPEPVLRFRIEEDNGRFVVSIEDSRENDAYTFTKVLMSDQNKLYTYFTNCNQDSCARMMRIEEKAYRHNRDSILNLYPGTYSADVLCRFYDFHAPEEGKQLPGVIKSELLNQTPWYISIAYNGKIINHMARLYLDYAPDTGAALKQSVLGLLGKTEAGSVPRNRLANILFDIFVDYVDERRLEQFLNLCTDSPALFTDPVLKEKCKRMARVMPGKKAPDISLPDSTGKEISFLDNAVRNKYTLLLIWNPDCPHCIAAMQVLKEAYNKYHNSGLGIFAVSLGNDKNEWLAAINNNKCNWTNVQVNEKNRTQPDDYFITYTPTLVLVNKQGQIVKRQLPIEELDSTLNTFFTR